MGAAQRVRACPGCQTILVQLCSFGRNVNNLRTQQRNKLIVPGCWFSRLNQFTADRNLALTLELDLSDVARHEVHGAKLLQIAATAMFLQLWQQQLQEQLQRQLGYFRCSLRSLNVKERCQKFISKYENSVNTFCEYCNALWMYIVCG